MHADQCQVSDRFCSRSTLKMVDRLTSGIEFFIFYSTINSYVSHNRAFKKTTPWMNNDFSPDFDMA